MKNLMIKFFVVATFITATSFKKKADSGTVVLEVSTISTMGGQATFLNMDTNTYYYINAVDTYGSEEVPYGNYELVSASTSSCNPPLISQVGTSSGNTSFTIDGSNPSFTIYANCY